VFHVVLYQPEIPPNTGNVIRLCANAGAQLHLVQPLGFSLDERSLRRAGLDYAELTPVSTWASLGQCLSSLGSARWFAITRKAATRYDAVKFCAGDALVFGPETRGLPDEVIGLCAPERRLAIPMRPGNRSLNLSNAVAVVVYEAWRQSGFDGAGH